MIALIGLFAAVPLVVVANWLEFVKRLPPREGELARAVHGAP